jgi:hypothetical protein
MALDGKICLCLHPPDYSNKKGEHGNYIESFNFAVRHGFSYSFGPVVKILSVLIGKKKNRFS